MGTEPNAHNTTGKELVASTASAAAAVAGEIIGPYDPVLGNTLKANAPGIGYFAGEGLVWVAPKVERICQWMARLQDWALGEGIDAELNTAKDLTEHAVPLIGRATFAEKQALIEDVLLNAVRTRADHIERALAADAMDRIDQMTPVAAIIFRELCGELELVPKENFWVVPNQGALEKLPPAQIERGLVKLCELGLIGSRGGGRDWKVSFTEIGAWLRDQIRGEVTQRESLV